MTLHRTRREEGFGIVVVALLFTAFSVIVAMMIDRSSVQLELDRQKQVEEQLSRLNVSLARYARYGSHRFPCPASYLLPTTDASFGAAVAADCRSTTPAGITEFGPGNQLVTGMVPVRELIPYGVSYSEAFDPWGSRVMYVVHRSLTTGSSDADVGMALETQRPIVQDYLTTDEITPRPDTVLISFGRDRMGGRLRSQGALASPSIACAAGTDRRSENCNGNRIFFRGPLITGTRVTAAEYFDDTVSTMRYTAATGGGPCSGTVVGGFCWYFGAVGQSCDTVCTTRGGYNAATHSYAGSGGTIANCQSVMTALGGTGTVGNNPGSRLGCAWMDAINVYQWTSPMGTDGATSHPSWRRACACNN